MPLVGLTLQIMFDCTLKWQMTLFSPEENCTGAVTCVMDLSEEEEVTTRQVKSVEGGAVQPVVGVSQRVRTGPKKKKDLGTMGMSSDSSFMNVNL